MRYIEATYNYPFVAVSIVVAILSSYVALELADVACKSQKKYHLNIWLGLSSVALGLGIGTMHFTGMFAYTLPIPVHYEAGFTFISLLLAITASFLGFGITHFGHNLWYTLLGGTIMGTGIAGMHYTGMRGMHLAADMHYDFLLVTLSVILAIAISSLALWLLVSLKVEKISRSFFIKTMAACMMGIAISSMHYTGMVALNLTFNEEALTDKRGFMIEGDLMAAALSFAAILLILLPLFTARYEKRFSQRLASELELLRINESRLRTLIENAPEEFYAYDIKGKIKDFNDAVCNDLGYSRDELKNTNIFDFEVSPTAKKLISNVWPSLETGASYSVNGVHVCKNGNEYPVEVNMTCIVDNGERYIFALARDITENENLKTHLSKLAMMDELTDLYNRRAFLSYFDKELSRAKRNNEDVSILMIDIDFFKKINDKYGHHVGDITLKHFSDVAKRTIRNEDIIGRFGGEEFSVLLPNTAINTAGILAERLRKAMENTFVEHDDQKINFTVSIGIATFDDKDINSDALMKNADSALYNAKENGRNRVMLYSA
jgi:diguanylate cyclase (GGDEF)-like protein/PAS domain S-box-containing protein